jgi:ribosomal protein L11 methyltransferase
VRWFPALEVRWPATPDPAEIERLLAFLDDDAPTAIEEIPAGVRVFFASRAQRECALHRFQACDGRVTCVPLDVADDDWAERSQATLRSVTIRRMIVSPPWDVIRRDGLITIVIQPSMGFGTGHHASTRLCLELLQDVPIAGRSVLDVGTGSGVLAIAAAALGASFVAAIDHDADALASARENAVRNQVDAAIEFGLVDLHAGMERRFDVVIANLTGGLLIREARRLTDLIAPDGTLVASGIERYETDDVVAALSATGLHLVKQVDQDGWTGLQCRTGLTTPSASTTS